MSNGYDHPVLSNQAMGATFVGVYYVEQAHVKLTTTKKDYTDMMLRDKSGSRSVKYWGVVPDLAQGQWVLVKATVDDYQGNPSLVAKTCELVEQPDDLSPYIPIYEDAMAYATRFEALREKIAEWEKEASDKTCSMLLDEVFKSSVVFNRFVTLPGSEKPHYGKQGGLLASTVRVAENCANNLELYRLSSLDKAIAVTSALLLKIGGIDAYEFVNCMPTMSTQGRLQGVASLGLIRVSAASSRVIAGLAAKTKAGEADVPVFNREITKQITHAIVASDSSSVKAMTDSAMLVLSIARTDNELTSALDFKANDLNVSQEFTAYDPVTQRKYYRGPVASNQPEAK